MTWNITKKRAAVLVGTVTVLGLVGVGAAVATSDDDASERPIPAGALDRAKAAALAHTGEGRVTGTEVDDEESKYEVEVTLDDGSEVDVQLDEAFQVVGDEAEDGAGEANGDD